MGVPPILLITPSKYPSVFICNIMEHFYWNTCYSREPMAYLVLQLEFTIVLLVLLAIVSGVTSSFLFVTYSRLKKIERENARLHYLVNQLRTRLHEQQSHYKPMEKTNIDLKILELYYKGYSLRQIARQVGLSHTTVHRRLRKMLKEEHVGIPSNNIIPIEA